MWLYSNRQCPLPVDRVVRLLLPWPTSLFLCSTVAYSVHRAATERHCVRQERMVTRGTIPCKCFNTIIKRISVVSLYNNIITVIVTKSNQVGHAMFKLIEFHSYLRWQPTDIASPVLLVVAKLRSGSFGQDLLVYTRCTCITWDRLDVCEYNERQQINCTGWPIY